MPEGEVKNKKLDIYLKIQILKENFPHLVKKIDMQVQEALSPKQHGYKEAHSKIYHN